ncbi:CopG family antitoxin [Dictyobacter formicarum]|uniref:CopG family transcriptional regulator n=1 Tax=Dictyobacter formicarum TaxID=2778368 RepID=A0ABQ3VIK1_9CHLR|nr:CopG family antitoxin [Dictyobacter formicarum]GHO85203.1 hypothetical protein KSZ_32090 [Dictyobacter formicarum]
MKKQKSKLPDFTKMSKDEEATFWETHSLLDFKHELSDVAIRIELDAPKEETLVVRIGKGVKQKLTDVAKRKGLSPSTLTRMWIMEKLQGV